MNAAPRIAVLLAALLAASAWAEHPRPPPGITSPAAPAQGRLQQLEARLQRAQAALEAGLDRGDKKRAMRQALEEISAARAELAAVVTVGPPPPPSAPPLQRMIREDSFNALVAALERERNPEDQLRVLREAAEGNLFQASHVQTLLSRLRYDAFRLRAAGLLVRRLVDPNNGFTLYAQLNGAFDKQVLQQLLAGAEANALVVAASEPQLQQLVNAVFQPWSAGERLAVLNARAGDQLLTTAQLRRVLDGFNSPRDRLTALQTMKRRLLDPRNAEVLAQAFWSPTDQREARRLLLDS